MPVACGGVLTVTHTQRWHAAHRTTGTGPLYQGRFKSFPIQEDDHLLTVLRIGAQAHCAKVVSVPRIGDGPVSAPRRQRRIGGPDGPVTLPENWLQHVQSAETEAELELTPAGFTVPLKAVVKTGRTWADCK